MGLKEAGLRGSLRNVSVGGIAIPDSVVSREADDDLFSGGGRVEGLEIETKTEWPSIGARFSDNTSGVDSVILRDSNKNVIKTVNTSGLSGGDTFTFDDVDLSADTKYQIVVDESSYTVGFTDPKNFPYTSPDVDITASVERDLVDASRTARLFNDIGDTGF